MNDIQERIAASFKLQGLMTTLGAELASVADGEVQIALPFSHSFPSNTAMFTLAQ
jgi:acyl-coenzyme A thioesterase PaaI-like protein